MKSNYLRIAVLTLLLAVISYTTYAYQTQTTSIAIENTSETKLIAVRMYADWCGNCKALDPKVDAIKGSFHARGVLFTRFDQTDEFAVAQSEMLAARTQLSAAFEEWKGKTGVMLLVDPTSGDILKVINHRMSPEEISAAIESLL